VYHQLLGVGDSFHSPHFMPTQIGRNHKGTLEYSNLREHTLSYLNLDLYTYSIFPQVLSYLLVLTY